MLDWVFGSKKTASSGKTGAPSYEESKTIAASGSLAERQQLAAHEDLQPEILYYFATDDDLAVRQTVAQNNGTPLQADLILAKDSADAVRLEVATKISTLLPTLRAEQNERLTGMVFEIMEVLAQDQLPAVRSIVAEEVKGMEGVPRPIVMMLAKDVEETVSVPILEFSKLLTEDDLLEIINEGLRGARLAAIARRPDLEAPVIDAVATTRDEQGVQALLENRNAELSEGTLETIIEAAPDHVSWHQALAASSNLTSTLALRLASFASRALVQKLSERADFDEQQKTLLENAVAQKLESENDNGDDGEPDTGMTEARQLHSEGKLTPERILRMISQDDRQFLSCALAVLANTDPARIKRIFKMQRAKSIVALAWRCELDMTVAVELQRKVAGLQPSDILKPTASNGYPLSDDDLSWQAELLFDE